MALLVVDDDDHIRRLVRHCLETVGFQVVDAPDATSAYEAMRTVHVELAILDVMMPGTDGFTLCESLRRRFDLPILMLSARTATSDKVRGFASGSDDYLVKPFEPAELVARVRALLRRYRINASQTVETGNVVLDRRTLTVEGDGASETIPRKEFELLFKLAGDPGRTFTRDQLIEDVWGPEFDGTERTVDVHINRLRDRFPSERSGFRIASVRGVGYRLEVL